MNIYVKSILEYRMTKKTHHKLMMELINPFMKPKINLQTYCTFQIKVDNSFCF